MQHRIETQISLELKVADLFAGIGGFHLAALRNGLTCTFACERDKFCRETYAKNFAVDPFYKDFEDIEFNSLPDFDLLCAGFPCQPFSSIGKQKGFEDERGHYIYRITDLLKKKQPKAFLLENSRGLKSHNHGRTFEEVVAMLAKSGYQLFSKVLYASDYGLPTFRPRLYMVGIRLDYYPSSFTFPLPKPLKLTMSDVLGGKCLRNIGYTIRCGGRRSGITDRHNWDSYIVDGSLCNLTIDQAKKMMGFPDDFVLPVSDTQAWKQLGNSVSINVIYEIIKMIKKAVCEN